MGKQYKTSDQVISKIKRDALIAYLLGSVILVILPPFLLLEYWYAALPVGVLMVPIWIQTRRKNFLAELEHVRGLKLEVLDSSLIIHFPQGKTELDCKNPQRLDVNFRSGDIKSMLLTMSEDNKVFIAGFEQLEEIKQHFIENVEELNVKEHHWFHKHK